MADTLKHDIVNEVALAMQKARDECGGGQIEFAYAEAAMRSALEPYLAQRSEQEFSDEQIKYMAQRFCAWPLPRNFNPDHGISFKNPWPSLPQHWPCGTNLWGYEEAQEMVRFMLEGLPPHHRLLPLSTAHQDQG
jgi:hypothetical protein